MYKYLLVILGFSLIIGCGKECDQDFFYISLPVSYSLDTECVQVNSSFTMTMDYADTLWAFTGIQVSREVERPFQDTVRIELETYDSINLVDIKIYEFVTSLSFQELNDSLINISDHPKVASEAFDVEVERGSMATSNFVNDNTSFSFTADRASSRNNLEVTITPKKVGSFYLSIFHGNAGLFDDPIVADGCEDLIQATYHNTSSVNDNVLYKATDSLHVSPLDLEKLIDGRGAFFFKVVDSTSMDCL